MYGSVRRFLSAILLTIPKACSVWYCSGTHLPNYTHDQVPGRKLLARTPASASIPACRLPLRNTHVWLRWNAAGRLNNRVPITTKFLVAIFSFLGATEVAAVDY